MSGLNVLLWTIAVILMLGVVLFIAIGIFAYRKRNEAIKKWQSEPTLWDKLNEAQREQEELIKQQRQKQ